MYHTTGFSRECIIDLCTMVRSETENEEKKSWPPILGLFNSVVVALTYMRRNRVQVELAETYGVSQSTISRAIKWMTPLLGTVTASYVPTADELDPDEQYVADGTLLPCWSWASQPDLYSGKRRTTGMNVQVVCTLDGHLAWISDPVVGCHHDVYCLEESGALLAVDPRNWVGDKGYVGTGMITPIKNPQNRELLDWEEEFNAQVNAVRYVVERVIANFKTWRIMHTDFRRSLDVFVQTISTVVGLHFYKIACE